MIHKDKVNKKILSTQQMRIKITAYYEPVVLYQGGHRPKALSKILRSPTTFTNRGCKKETGESSYRIRLLSFVKRKESAGFSLDIMNYGV